MSADPRTPLPPHHLLIRQEIMNGNGINYIFPLGRDYGLTYPDNFEGYDGSGLSVFGYIVDPNPLCEIAYVGGNVDKNAITGYENDVLQYVQPMYIKSIHVHEYFARTDSHVILSLHYGDYPPSVFPLDTGLDPLIPALVVMELGSYAVYDGIYSGSDAINVIAPGAVRDLGKPATSGVNVRIGIRKNLTMYVFVADYGSAPVAAPFAELVSGGGHAYIPRFTPNFNVRRVQIESYY
ncbi:hypothetical protein MTO96_010114 [Rhipicephalus appendiculatus]